MDYVQNLYNIANDYWLVTVVLGVGICFVESFLPILPLIAIVSINAILFGLVPGLMLSWIGSGLGTVLLFIVASRFNENILFNKVRNEKTEIIVNWIQRQGFKLLFFSYSCPFVPSFLITIASAFCKMKIVDFVPAMLAGKFVMFLVVSYPSSDIEAFLSSPIKIIVFLGLVLMSWKIGNKVNNSLSKNKEEE